MKKRVLTVFLVACYILVLFTGTALAMPETSQCLVIEDFEDYFSIEEVLSQLFDGAIGAQADMEPISELSNEYFFDGNQSLGMGGIYHPLEDQVLGMISPYMRIPASKQDWTGAKYIQFWIKNPSEKSVGIRLEVSDSSGKFISLPTGNFEVEHEKRSGEDVFLPLKGNSNRRIYVPAHYEGVIRVPLSLYEGLVNLSGMQRIYWGMSLSWLSGEIFYFDNICVVKEGYKNPNAKVYPPELKESFLRIDEQTGNLSYTARLDTANAVDTVDMEVFDASGKSLGLQSADTDAEHYIRIDYKLPEKIESGKYKVVTSIKGYKDQKEENIFPIYNMEPTTYGDVWNTKYEQAVELLSKMGIISGYEDGTFRPDKTITRAEFAALMVRILAMDEKAKTISEAPFNDTAGHWSAGNIAVGVEQGIINGYGDGRFGPDDTVTYEQAMKMIVAALGYGGDADAAGGYPAGYMTVGKNIGIERDIRDENPTAIRGNIAIMLRNAIAAEIKENGVGAGISLMNKNFEKKMDDLRYKAAIAYGDNILKYDRDVYGSKETPLMIDGINIFTMQPATYVYNGVKSVITNFACQQNTLRTLDALTNMTGDTKYVDRAKEATKYFLENIVDKVGTPYMGGHAWWDSYHEKRAVSKSPSIELKQFYPYYDMWYKTDKDLASRSVGAIWDSKMTDWSILQFSRHGTYDKKTTAIWDNEFKNPEPWYKGNSGLPFYMSGSDLIVAAKKEQKFAGNEKAGVWADRLFNIYVAASDKTTHLIPDIYLLSGGSSIRDRGLDQFAEDFPEETYGMRATEGNYQGTYLTTSASVASMMELYDQGLIGDDYLNALVGDHLGYIKYQYDPETHKVKPILADGTDLTGYVLKKDGYFGSKGGTLSAADVGRESTYAFVALHLRSGKQELWDYARDVCEYYGLGDIGTKPGENVKVNLATKCVQPDALAAMCEIYQKTGCEDYLKLAKAIANNSMLMAKRGFFMTLYEKAYVLDWKWNKVYANFNDEDALSILRIQAIMDGKTDAVPAFTNSYGNILDDYDTIKRSTIGENTAIFNGEYDIDAILDAMK